MASILIIEDEDEIREIIARKLEREGYEVIEAADGKEGIERYRERQTDLIITDIIMPYKEGIDTICELKNEFDDLKIIAISGGGSGSPDDYLEAARLLGVQRTLSKPFTPEELLTAVRELIGG